MNAVLEARSRDATVAAEPTPQLANTRQYTIAASGPSGGGDTLPPRAPPFAVSGAGLRVRTKSDEPIPTFARSLWGSGTAESSAGGTGAASSAEAPRGGRGGAHLSYRGSGRLRSTGATAAAGAEDRPLEDTAAGASAGPGAGCDDAGRGGAVCGDAWESATAGEEEEEKLLDMEPSETARALAAARQQLPIVLRIDVQAELRQLLADFGVHGETWARDTRADAGKRRHLVVFPSPIGKNESACGHSTGLRQPTRPAPPLPSVTLLRPPPPRDDRQRCFERCRALV